MLKDLVLRYGTCLIDALQHLCCYESCLGFQELVDREHYMLLGFGYHFSPGEFKVISLEITFAQIFVGENENFNGDLCSFSWLL